ncbi:MAG: hypothetical protein RR011_00135 [Oscillospiraceae bacterium]
MKLDAEVVKQVKMGLHGFVGFAFRVLDVPYKLYFFGDKYSKGYGKRAKASPSVYAKHIHWQDGTHGGYDSHCNNSTGNKLGQCGYTISVYQNFNYAYEFYKEGGIKKE